MIPSNNKPNIQDDGFELNEYDGNTNNNNPFFFSGGDISPTYSVSTGMFEEYDDEEEDKEDHSFIEVEFLKSPSRKQPFIPYFLNRMSQKRVKMAMMTVAIMIIVSILFFTIFFVIRYHISDNKHNENNPKVNPLIVISIDGFRYDFLDRGLTPNIKSIYSGSNGYKPGVRANYMTPQFPSKTFPNHYTLATGLYPESHGITSNTFYDTVLNETFSTHSSTELVDNPKWWLGEPIWQTATRSNITAACYYWPGCGAFNPKYNVVPYKRIPAQTIMDQVLSWQLNEKPALTMAYLYDVDYVAHNTQGGPNSIQVNQTMVEVDKAIGTLIAGLKENGLYNTTNIIILSDHGMTTITDFIDVSSLINTTSVYAPDVTPILSIYENSIGGKDAIIDTYNKLKGANLSNIQVYLKEDIPPQYKYNNSDRIAPLIAVADEGYQILLNTQPWLDYGEHGYNNSLTDMRAIFLGHGPNLKNNITNFSFPNIEVFNFLSTLLNITTPPSTNGTNYLTDLLYTK